MLIRFCVAVVIIIGRCTTDENFLTKTVHVGEDVTLTCSRQSSKSGVLLWIRVVAGNLPETLGATYTFDSSYVNKTPRITVKQEPGTFVLHITKTKLSDTAFYYCQQVIELQTTSVNGTFLRVKGPESDITAVIQDFPSDPVRPGDSVTLQCSVLSDSEKETCSGEHRVHWFRAGSGDSYPSVIYTHVNRSDQCEKSREARSPQKCVYSFSRSVSSSDAGTYYCAVATCGEILFGNGAKLDIEEEHGAQTILLLLCVALALSVIVIALLIYTIKKQAAVLQTNTATTAANQQSEQRDEDSLIYAVPHFTKGKAGRRRRTDTDEGESVYADVRVLV